MHEKDWHKADMSVHGTSGPLHIEPHDLAPISERVKESMIDVGLPYHPDMFSTGETPNGCGDVPRTVHQGIRTTAADFITKGYKRANITIKTEVVVDKVLFSSDSGEPSATGVATISKAGKKIEYQAKKEVIVTAGAYCSPTILMRSGLGPEEELKKHGIECRVDLPGVGQNLQDHCVRESHRTTQAARKHTNTRSSSYSSSTKFPNPISQTTTSPTTTTLSHPHTNSTRRRRQVCSVPSPLVSPPRRSPISLLTTRHLRLRAPRRPPAGLRAVAQRPPQGWAGPHGSPPLPAQHGVLEHRALRRPKAIRRLPDRRQTHIRHVQSLVQPAESRER